MARENDPQRSREDLLEGAVEVEITEYGEVVERGTRPSENKGIRLKPHTFY